jgi:hypothetical protein
VTGKSVRELAERCMIEPGARVSWHGEALREIRDRFPRPEMRAPCLLQSQPNSRFLKRSTTTGLKMAMMPQLYSISGLAVELNVDRRTVAARLRNVTPDGLLPRGSPGWRLATALRAMNWAGSAVPQPEVLDPIASFLQDRLARPSISRKGGRILLSVSEAAQMLGISDKRVLLWLRGGAPHVSEGDWSTGKGFVIDLSHVVGWLILVAAHLIHIGRNDLYEALQLPGPTGCPVVQT